MNWISALELKDRYPTSWRKELTRLEAKWNKTPTDEELKELREILESYLEYAETQRDKEIINGILANEEFFKRAILVTDGSYMPLRIYAWSRFGKSTWTLAFRLKRQSMIPSIMNIYNGINILLKKLFSGFLTTIRPYHFNACHTTSCSNGRKRVVAIVK